MLKRPFVAAALLALLPLSSGAALINRGGGFVYDTVADVTWLQDWNYRASQGISDTRLNWEEALAWAAGLDVNGLTGWMLPTTTQFHDAWADTDFSAFQNLQLGGVYWTREEFQPSPSRAYTFDAQNGHIDEIPKLSLEYVVAVRAGDVRSVPEPSSLTMVAGLLAGLTFAARASQVRK